MDTNQDNKRVKDAIHFLKDGESWARNAISNINDGINTPSKFAITKLTNNGKWMRGKLLYYCMNGIDIYTDADNIIFVDLDANNVFIRRKENFDNEINPKDPETKEYVILYTDINYNDTEEEYPFRWESVVGRTQAYYNIKDNIRLIDINKSIVLAETVAIKDALSVKEFIEYLKNSNLAPEDDFDISEFNDTYLED